ncbi:MAG TPA: hypothetical protein VHC94_20635 [Nitrobacter sp.]|jgi:hypothetical protein|nr:hypothetical protein [Nitrobacter sp.]
MRSCLSVLAVIVTMSPAFGQTNSPPNAPSSAPAATAQTVPVAPDGKRAACRQEVDAKGLRGQERRDQMQLCMAQGQLDCLKQAIDQKSVGSARKDFMRTCMGRRDRGGRK